MVSNKSKSQSEKLLRKMQEADKDSGQNTSLRDRAHNFYICEIHRILKTYKRGPIMVFSLMIIYFSQIIGNLFTPEIIEELNTSSPSSKEFIRYMHDYFYYFKLYPLYSIMFADGKSEENAQTQFLLIACLLNTILVLYIVIRLIHYIFWQYYIDISISTQDSTERLAKKSSSSSKILTVSDYVFSFLFRIYLYLFAIPFTQISMKVGIEHYNENASPDESYQLRRATIFMSIYVWILTLSIMTLISNNEYDYSIIIKDYLAQQKNYFVFIRITLDIIGSGIFLSTSKVVIKIFTSINCIIRLAICLFRRPFSYAPIMNFTTQICVYYAIVLIIVTFLPASKDQNYSFLSFSILLFCSIPLSSRVGILLLEVTNFDSQYMQPFIEKDIKKIKAEKFDKHIRNIIDLFSLPYEEYMKNGLGIKFETIFANHLDCCFSEQQIKESKNTVIKEDSTCFCYQYTDKFLTNNKQSNTSFQKQQLYTKDELNVAVANVIGEDHRRSFLIKYTNHLIQKYFNASSKNYTDQELKVKPTYLYFLCQIANTPAKAFQQICQLKLQMNQSSLQIQSLLQEIINDVNLSFSQYVYTTTYQNQRLSISSVYEFDYLYKDFITSLKAALQSRQRYYEFLCSDYISLTELLKESESCLATKRIAEAKIRNLFDIHPHHPRLLNIAEIYIEFFDFRKRRVHHFIQKSKQLMNRNLQRVDLKIDLFDQMTCSMFVSLHNKQIIKASNSVSSFFKCQKQELIGKQFTMLLPEYIIPSFNKYIDLLLEEGNMDMIKIGEYLTFLNNPITKLISPVYLRTKIDILSNSEFGLSVQIQQARSCRVSILTDNDYNIISCTKEFQNLIFKFFDDSGTTKSNKKGIDLIKTCNAKTIIPLIYSFNQVTQDINSFDGYNETFGFKDQKIQNYQTFKSLLLLPTNMDSIKKLSSFTKDTHKDVQDYFSNLNSQDFEFLEITFSPFSYKLHSDTNPNIKIIELQSYKKLRTYYEINDLFQRLKEILTAKFQQEVIVPMFQTNSPHNNYEKGSPSYLNIGLDKKYSQLQKGKSEFQISETMQQSTRSNKDSFQNNSDQHDNYIEDEVLIQNNIDGVMINNTNLIGDSNSYFGYDPFYEKIQKKQINNLIEGIQLKYLYQLYRKDSDYIYDSPQIGCNSIENIIDQQFKSKNFIKTARDSKSTKIDESIAGTSRQSFLSPKFPNDVSTHQLIHQEESAKIQHLYPLTSPQVAPSQSFLYSQERQLSSTFRKESDQYEKNKSLQKSDSNIQQESSSFSQMELYSQRNRSRFFSQKAHLQITTQQNLLSVRQNKTGKEYHQEEGSENSQENGKKENEEDDDGVIQLSILPSKQGNKGKNGKKQMSGQFQDEEESQEQKDRKNVIMDDQQSVRTGSSQIFSKKQSLFEMIASRREPLEVRVSKIIGILAFLILISISCVLFVKVKQNFQDEWINYSNLIVGKQNQIFFLRHVTITVFHYHKQIGPNLLEGFSQILRIKELLTLLAVNKDYNYLFSKFTVKDQLLFQNEALSKLQFITTEIGNFQSNTIHDGFEDFMLNNITTLITQNTMNTDKILVNFTRMYSLLNLPSNLREYLTKNDALSRVFTYMNYNSFISTIQTIQDTSTIKARQTLSDTQSLLNMSIIIIQVVCVFTVLIVFPVYKIIQSKREEIICLLVTFDPQFLQQQIEKYRNALQEKMITQSISNLSKFDRSITKTKATSVQQVSILDFTKGIKPQNKNKKRQISHTNSLPKFSLRLSFLTFLIFIVISLYCLLNYLLTKDFFEFFVYNIQELSLISQSKSYLGLNFCGLYLLTNSYAYKFDSYTVGLILEFFNTTVIPNNEKRIESFYNIDSNFIHSRYNQDLYEKYFINIVKADACAILNTTYGQPFIQNNNFTDIKNCTSVQKGMLSKGLTFTFKQLFGKIQTYYSNYLATIGNPLLFFKSIKLWDYDNNFRDFDQLYYYLRAILDSQSEFLIEQSQDYFDYLMSVSQALFIYNLVIVFLVFTFAWRKFLLEMTNQIQETTYLLSLMPIEQLLDNPYVISYINKIKSSIKRSS